MITSILTTMAVALLAAPTDHEQIQGSLKLVFREGDRTRYSPELSSAFTITTFWGDERLTEWISDEAEKWDTFVLHPGRNPKAIELHSRDAEGRSTTHVGAYELEGDTLKLCLRYGMKELPPPDFICKPGPARMYWVLKRVKPGSPPDPAPAEVVITDEHGRGGGDPTEIKVAVTNKTKEIMIVSFAQQWHLDWFKIHLFDERGRAVVLPEIEWVRRGGSKELVRIKPGASVSGYLSPRWDYEIPAGRYQISVTFVHTAPGSNVPQKVESNEITKTFP